MSQGNPASKVGEIFLAAGAAFSALAEMTVAMHKPVIDQSSSSNTQGKGGTKRKVNEDVSRTSKKVMSGKAQDKVGPTIGLKSTVRSGSLMPQSAKSADITLNMLNATELEVDVEGLPDNKLEYDCQDV